MAEKKKFLLRLDPALYAAMERWAADELRSVNGQLEFVISEALRKAGRGASLGSVPRTDSSAGAGAGSD